MYDYTICSEPDEEIFKKQCKALEKHIPNLEKTEMLVDVDSSKTQIYIKDGKQIAVHNSYYIGAVFIKSEIDIQQFFA